MSTRAHVHIYTYASECHTCGCVHVFGGLRRSCKWVSIYTRVSMHTDRKVYNTYTHIYICERVPHLRLCAFRCWAEQRHSWNKTKQVYICLYATICISICIYVYTRILVLQTWACVCVYVRLRHNCKRVCIHTRVCTHPNVDMCIYTWRGYTFLWKVYTRICFPMSFLFRLLNSVPHFSL